MCVWHKSTKGQKERSHSSHWQTKDVKVKRKEWVSHNRTCVTSQKVSITFCSSFRFAYFWDIGNSSKVAIELVAGLSKSWSFYTYTFPQRGSVYDDIKDLLRPGARTKIIIFYFVVSEQAQDSIPTWWKLWLLLWDNNESHCSDRE